MPQLRFLLEASDFEPCCPVLQAMLPVDDPRGLRAILGAVTDEDPELEYIYRLDDADLAASGAAFDFSFDAAQLDCRDLDLPDGR